MPHPSLAVLAAALAACLAMPCLAARAVGTLTDVQVVDRNTGETLTPIFHRGEWWIAGRPGSRYAVTLSSRDGSCTLNVLSVDGVNAITGSTAAWNQSGYVLDGYDTTEVRGWRKGVENVAAFEFTTLPDSYAARTGRPANVGVIGVAVFHERARPVITGKAAPAMRGAVENEAGRDATRDASPEPMQSAPSPAAPSPSSDPAAGAAARARSFAPPLAKQEKLGTGHGEIESSAIRMVSFERQQPTPNEVVTIRYDRKENLIAMGILPSPVASASNPRPFPNDGRFVPDPPRR